MVGSANQNMAHLMRALTDFMGRIVRIAQAAILLSLLILIVAGVPLLVEYVKDAYDRAYPVWTQMEATAVQLQDNAVTLRLKGHKMRPCRFLRIYAVSQHAIGAVQAGIHRLDRQEIGSTRPLGFQDLGVWEIKPILPEALSVSVYVENECDGRLILLRLANVAVPR